MKTTATTPIAWTNQPSVAAKSMISSGAPKCLSLRGIVFITSALLPITSRVALVDSLQRRTTNAAEAFLGRPSDALWFSSVRDPTSFNVAPRGEGILDFMNINAMSLGTLDLLHVYVA